ncbi:MAG TPA: hypothetical protein VL282_09930 [Tepidisphaeraceae bacterium]|jgi:hypothetical protein|nr:hypothetical protein [Tepidisphaeraceae bacterium]
MSMPTADGELAEQKQQLLIEFHQMCWNELSWRRTAGYRTIIFGLGYLSGLLAVLAFNHNMPHGIRICMAIVVAIATLFGSGYLVSNYYKYTAAFKKCVAIEEYVGAYDNDFLGKLGPLMPPGRKAWADLPLLKNPVCIWSIIAFAAGGLVTAFAILMM